jgi:nucleoid-associated protein YgaU
VLHPGSRYAATPVVTPPDGGPRTLARRRVPSTPGALEHVVMEGERLDQLAARFYGDPRKWWLIADANPEELDPRQLLRPGRRIRVPRDQAVRA